MRLEMMFPHQIRDAIARDVPVVLPVGVLEYHGEHLAVGLDTIVVIRLVEALEREMEMVVMPPFHFGAASHAVAGPEGTGTLHVDSAEVAAFAERLFAGLLRIGFRNIHFFVHHQTENFAAGMPTDLAFKFAARRAIFAQLERERGEGWWGAAGMADYYARQSTGADPFNWIKGHPLMNADILTRYPFDHAGKGETSLMMALCPEGVDMDRHTDAHWYTADAPQASAALGAEGAEMILGHMRACLSGG